MTSSFLGQIASGKFFSKTQAEPLAILVGFALILASGTQLRPDHKLLFLGGFYCTEGQVDTAQLFSGPNSNCAVAKVFAPSGSKTGMCGLIPSSKDPVRLRSFISIDRIAPDSMSLYSRWLSECQEHLTQAMIVSQTARGQFVGRWFRDERQHGYSCDD